MIVSIPQPRCSCRSNSSKKLRIALYSHDTMGLGHIRRNQLISHALASSPLSPNILIISGTAEASSFSVPASADLLVLPSFGKDSNGHYKSKSIQMSIRELVELRAKTIAAALEAFSPDVFIVDKVPRGALRELDLTLEALRSRGSTVCILGLRDVLDEPRIVRREWLEAENEKAIRDYFQAIWIYGDRSIYDSARKYRFSQETMRKASYMGYHDQRFRLEFFDEQPGFHKKLDPQKPYVLCLVGGGQDGAQLAESFVQSRLPSGLNGLLITGPFMPQKSLNKIREIVSNDSQFIVLEFVSETAPLMKRATKVISMGGYNAMCEILSFEKPALIVPRVIPRKEQLIRAQHFHKMGLIDLLEWNDVTSDALTAWIRREQHPPGVHNRVDFGGLQRIQDSLTELVGNAFGVKVS